MTSKKLGFVFGSAALPQVQAAEAFEEFPEELWPSMSAVWGALGILKCPEFSWCVSILSDDVRSANVIADEHNVECLVIDRE